MVEAPRIITLTTDFGVQDEYVGVVKGVILSVNPHVVIVDITHEIPPQDVLGASFILGSSFRFFKKGSIHLAVVDPGVGSARHALVLEAAGHLFVGPDNGLFSFLSSGEIKRAVRVTDKSLLLPEIGKTFHGRDIFAPVAAHISRGRRPESLGPAVDPNLLIRHEICPVHHEGGLIVGKIVWIDRFGNLTTSIDKRSLEKLSIRGRPEVFLMGRRVGRLFGCYSDVQANEPLALLGSRDLVEISVNMGSAEKVFGASVGDSVEVRLMDDR